MRKKDRTVTIPDDLIIKIEEEIKGTDIKSLSDYVIKVLRDKLNTETSGDAFNEEDEEKVKERLKALGYMD